MAIVEIMPSLYEEIRKKFKKEGIHVLKYLKSLENEPKKGKDLGSVGGVVIKELKYKSFRFYFITDGYKVRYFDSKHLKDLLLKFVRMSNKKDQQKVINEIRIILGKIGPSGFE